MATIFGEVTYKRTYYVYKITGEYKYLSDEAVGIEANDRMDILLESMLIEEAIEIPYRKSSEKNIEECVSYWSNSNEFY